MGGIGGMAV